MSKKSGSTLYRDAQRKSIEQALNLRAGEVLVHGIIFLVAPSCIRSIEEWQGIREEYLDQALVSESNLL